MGEGQLGGVEALARQTGHGLFGPVHHIPQQGVPQIRHVDADLVGAARLQAAGDVGMAVLGVDDLPVGNCLPPVWGDRHALAVCGVPPNGGVHRTAILPEGAHRHPVVQPEQGVILQLGGQGQVGPVVLRRDEQAGGVPVDAVDDAGTQLPVDSGEGIFTVI